MVKETNYGSRFNSFQGVWLDIDKMVRTERGSLAKLALETREIEKTKGAGEAAYHLGTALDRSRESAHEEHLITELSSDPGIRRASERMNNYLKKLDSMANQEF